MYKRQERGLEVSLDRTLIRLDLPAMERGTVVVNGEAKMEGLGGIHREKVARERSPSKPGRSA